MPRLALAAFVLAAGLTSVSAQDTAPATITVNPSATISQLPKAAQLLTGLYATLATLELCAVEVPEPATSGMSAHRRQMETELRMDEKTSTTAYERVRADVEKAGLDCAEGSADRQQADAVVAIYAGI
ncbi:MAG: hypothetical protein KIS86_18505 [Devosia sp.]|nr:hypothetical protein [Devosia sp.]